MAGPGYTIIPNDWSHLEYVINDLTRILDENTSLADYVLKDGTRAFTGTGAGFKDEDNMSSDSAVAAASQQSIKAYVDTLGTGYQPLDADLTSIALLGTAANRMLYTTDVSTWAETALTAAGRAILDDADASAQRTTLGLIIGTNVQAWDAQLDDIAGLAVTNSNFIVGDGSNWVAESGATVRTSLGLGAGNTPTFDGLVLTAALDMGDNSINNLTNIGNMAGSITSDQGSYALSFADATDLIFSGAEGVAFRPTTDSRLDLGTSSYYWRNAYVDNIIVSTKLTTPEIENTGDITIDAINAAADSTITLTNSDATWKANLDVEGDVTVNRYLYIPGSYIYHSSADADTGIVFGNDLFYYIAGGWEFLRVYRTVKVNQISINEGANDIDLRIEGTTDPQLFRSDAENNRIAVGAATPAAKFQVVGDTMFGDAATNYTAFSATGVQTMAGSAKVTRHLWVNATSMKKNGAEPATAGLNSHMIFRNNFDDEVYYSTHVPYRRAANTDMLIELLWYQTGGGAEDTCEWNLSYNSVAHTGEDPTGAGTALAEQAVALAVDTVGHLTFTVPAAVLVNHDTLFFKIWRDGSDALGVSSLLLGIHIHFIVDKLGEAT